MWKLLCLLIIVSNSASQNLTCDENNIVDLKTGNRLPNGDIYYDGHMYTRTEYITGNGTISSCICLKEICILKCCPHGMGYNSKIKRCQELAEPFNIRVVDEYLRVQSHNISDYFHIAFQKPQCLDNENRIRLKQLYSKRIEVRSVSIYCHLYLPFNY